MKIDVGAKTKQFCSPVSCWAKGNERELRIRSQHITIVGKLLSYTVEDYLIRNTSFGPVN